MSPLNSPKEKLTEQRIRTLSNAARISCLVKGGGPTIGPNAIDTSFVPEEATTTDKPDAKISPPKPESAAEPAPKWRYDSWRPVRTEAADTDSAASSSSSSDQWRPTPTHLTLADCRAVRFRMATRSAENAQRQIVRKAQAARQCAYDEMLDQLQRFRIDETAKALEAVRAATLAKEERILAAARQIDAEAAAEAEQLRRENEEHRRRRAERTERLRRDDEIRQHFEAIKSAKQLFIVVFERLVRTILQQQQQLVNFAEYSAGQTAYLQRYEELLARVNGGQIGAKEVAELEHLCEEMQALQRRVDEEVSEAGERLQQLAREEEEQKRVAAAEAEAERRRQAEEQERLAEAERKEREAQQEQLFLQEHNRKLIPEAADPAAIESLRSSDATATATHRFVHPQRLEMHAATMEFYEQYKLSVKPLQADDSRKSYRFNCQKAVNIPLNAISAVTPQHLADKYDRLCALLAGAAVQVGQVTVSAAEHPLGVRFCSLLAAKKLVQQADSMISTDPKHAFPIAAIIVAVWQRFPDVGRLTMAYLYKESPYLVPYFVARSPAQTDGEFLQSLGYRWTEAEGPESTEMYLKRQTGMARLYAAIVAAQPRRMGGQGGGGEHPHGLAKGWEFLAHFMNLEPIPDVCATILHEFLVVAGADLWRTYGAQFHKLVLTLFQQYLARLTQVADKGGPRARLEGLLVRMLEEQRCEEPEGRLQPNFW